MSNAFGLSDADLERLMSRATSFDDRKRLLMDAMTSAWGRGWDDCMEETLRVLSVLGPEPVAAMREKLARVH